MSKVLFISDLHLGHKNILKFTQGAAHLGAYRGGSNVDEHDEWVIEQLLAAKPTKNTTWWILGDVCMDIEKLPLLDKVPGRKNLIMGNHDDFKPREYLPYFYGIRGPMRRYGMWMTHIPMRPEDLWGYPNIHGHVHYNPYAGDSSYFNACIEFIPGNKPISLEELREFFIPPEVRVTL